MITALLSAAVLAWDPLGPSVDGYYVYSGASSQAYTARSFTPASSVPLTLPAAAYYTVTAVRDGVEGGFSSEAHYDPNLPLLSISSPSPGLVVLSWPAVPFSGYSVQHSTTIPPNWITLGTGTLSAGYYRWTNLVTSPEEFFRLKK